MRVRGGGSEREGEARPREARRGRDEEVGARRGARAVRVARSLLAPSAAAVRGPGRADPPRAAPGKVATLPAGLAR